MILGYLLGGGGLVGGAWFIAVRRAAYLAAIRQQRALIAPLLWQLSAGAGMLIIVLSLLFALLLIVLGRTLGRVERLERARAGRDEVPA